MTVAEMKRRDYIILPLLSVATILIMLVATEFAARRLWPDRYIDTCLVHDGKVRARFKPDCDSLTKTPEGPWVRNHYNECGYRSMTSCAVKPPDSIRIVLMGSSFSQGDYTPYEATFPVEAAQALSHACARRVEFQNMGVQGATPADVYRRTGEALALKPDAVLYPVTPFDLEQSTGPEDLEHEPNGLEPGEPPDAAKVGIYRRAGIVVRESRTVVLAQHYLFQDPAVFTRLFLAYGDKADFLRQPYTAAWEKRFDLLDEVIAHMAARFRAAGVPIFLTAAPSRAEVVLLNMHPLPPGVDPYAFFKSVSGIAARHDAEYIDLLSRFQAVPRADLMFYVVDGHLKGEGQAIVARAIVDAILHSRMPVFSNCRATTERADSRP
ncbi:MAG: SGNH/GDSL hydrolase family protein [Acidobacteriaceae bacterium]|nr:SGNH/GDSL hydrolase family protein [Acidobacteriaceae bacterium]